MKVVNTNKLNLLWTYGILPIKHAVDNVKLKLANNLVTTEEGYGLDARQGPVIQRQIDEINGKLTANMFMVSSVISSAISIPANETKSGTVNCAKSGYAPLGIVGIRGVGVSVGIYYIDGNTLNFNLKNYYSYARTETTTFFVLYRKL